MNLLTKFNLILLVLFAMGELIISLASTASLLATPNARSSRKRSA